MLLSVIMARKPLTVVPIETLSSEASIHLSQAKKQLDELYYASSLRGVAWQQIPTLSGEIIGHLSFLIRCSRDASAREGNGKTSEKTATLKIEQQATQGTV